MKHNSILCALGVLFAALTAQATVITWALPEGGDYASATSAQLVYVASGALSFNADGSIANGTALGTAVTGDDLANVKAGDYGQTSVSSVETTGNYYLLLLNTGSTPAQYSAASIAASGIGTTYSDQTDPSALVTASWSPASTDFSAWAAATPEPSSVALLLIGAAVAAYRRKKMIA